MAKQTGGRMITLRNDFHNTSVRLRVPASGRITARQYKRACDALCGSGTCLCGGVRGKQDVVIESLFDKYPPDYQVVDEWQYEPQTVKRDANAWSKAVESASRAGVLRREGGKRHHSRAKCGNVNPHEGLTCTRHAGHEGLHIGSMKGRLVQWCTNADWFEGVEFYDRSRELQKQRAWKLRQKTHTHACDDCGHSLIPGTKECPSCGSQNVVSKAEIAAQAAELRKALRR